MKNLLMALMALVVLVAVAAPVVAAPPEGDLPGLFPDWEPPTPATPEVEPDLIQVLAEDLLIQGGIPTRYQVSLTGSWLCHDLQNGDLYLPVEEVYQEVRPGTVFRLDCPSNGRTYYRGENFIFAIPE
jgi:hypothetical protein